MQYGTQHTTRVNVDRDHHVIVDWTISGYDIARESWLVSARCRLWRNTELHSGVSLAVRPMTPLVDIDAEGPSLEHVLAHVMREAHDRCLAALAQ